MRGAIALVAVIVVVGLGMWWAGWLSVSSTETQTQIQFDKQEAESDTRETIEAGKRLVDEVDRNVDVDVGPNVDRDGEEQQPAQSGRDVEADGAAEFNVDADANEPVVPRT